MRNIIILFSFFFIALLAQGANLTLEADSAYSDDNFQEAAELYLKVINEDGNSPILQYNLGNCYYRMGLTGKAIVAYERALRLDPRMSEAKTNLEFVNSRIIDRQGENGTFFSNLFDSIANRMSSNAWAWIAISLFIIMISGLAAYFFSHSVTIKKLGFFSAIFLFLISIIAIIFSIRARNISLSDDFAVITSPSVILSTSPREPKDRNEEALLLHEGTKVQIIDSITNHTDSLTVGSRWYEIQIDNTHRAWIKSTELERI